MTVYFCRFYHQQTTRNNHKKQQKKSAMDKSSSQIHENSPSVAKLGGYYEMTEDGLKRERRLALLTLWREAAEKALPSSQALELNELSAQPTIAQLDESRELPELLRYMDVTTYGRPLWYFCVDQLSTKDRPPLWCILEFLATELPTAMAIDLLERTRDALVRFQVEPLDSVCLKIIASSTYPIATALYLAAFMSENGVRDSSRSDQFRTKSQKYIDIATHLLSQIESDHLLAILIEIPSNIDDMSILDVVIRFKLEGFLEFHRLQPIFMNMWYQYEYLDPSKPFRNREADSIDALELCYKSSALFYYSPVGAFIIQCTTYILNVLLVSYVTIQQVYPYKSFSMWEVFMWVFSAGFVLYEMIELGIRGFTGYFQYYSNWLGFINSIIWIILAAIRFVTYSHFLDSYYCQLDNCPTIESFPCPADVDFNIELHDDPCYRNAPLTEIYMILWAIQVVLLWCRMAALLQRNKHAGPLIRMILNMMVEIATFAVLLFLFVIGVVLAVYYIVGGDVPPSDELGGGLNRMTSVMLYNIQALLAAQEWSVITSNDDDGFNTDRSIMVETCMVFLSIFGTLLLMNLFIAMLTITYESQKQTNELKTNFARITHTIELDRKSAVMPPPLNILVFVLTILYVLFEVSILFFTCGYWMSKLQILYPIQYSLYKELKMKEKETKHRRRASVFTNHMPPSGGSGRSPPRPKAKNSSLISGMGISAQSLKIQTQDDDDSDYDSDQVANYQGINNMELLESTGSILNAVTREVSEARGVTGLPYKTHCGCFIRTPKQKPNACKNLNKQWKLRGRESYCRHCRHSLSTEDGQKNGKIDRYFELFKYWQLLDEDDKKLLRLRLNKRNICPHCYRTYKSDPSDNDKRRKKHGLSRFQVILEVMSYYVFKILIWWWLFPLLSIPAAFTLLFKWLNHDYHEHRSKINEQIIGNVSNTDPEYRLKVEQVIKEYNNREDPPPPSNNDNMMINNRENATVLNNKQNKSDQIEMDKDGSPSPMKKYQTLHPKHKTRTDLKFEMFQDSVEQEANDLYVGNINKLDTIYSKSRSAEMNIDDKFDKLDNQIEELRQLILSQNELKTGISNMRQVSNDSLVFTPNRKRVTFNDDQKETQFNALVEMIKEMNTKLSTIKTQLDDNDNNSINKTPELYHREHTPRDDIVRPRGPSHARSANRPIGNQLDIDNILPSSPNKSTAL